MSGSRLPDQASGPSDCWSVVRVCAASEAHGASPSAPPHNVFSPVPPPHTPGSPAPALACRPRVTLGRCPWGLPVPGLVFASCCPEPDLLGFLGSWSLRTSVRALRSLPLRGAVTRWGAMECSYVTIPLRTVITAVSPVFDLTTQSPSVFATCPVSLVVAPISSLKGTRDYRT